MNDRYGPDFPGMDSSQVPKPPPKIPEELRDESEDTIETSSTSKKIEIPIEEPSKEAKSERGSSSETLTSTEQVIEEKAAEPAKQKGKQKDKAPARNLSPSESNWAMGVHLAAVFGYISFIGFAVGPLVVWFLKRNEDPFIDEQGKEAINFQLSMILYYIGAGILSFVLVGIPILIALFIFQLVEIILASVRAKEGISYRYPLTIRFLS